MEKDLVSHLASIAKIMNGLPIAIVVGAIVGSFLNVVIHRLPLRESIVFPGSHCVSCGAPVRWWANIPLVSFLALRGRCADCKARISIRYPIIEGVTALLFALATWRYGLDSTLVFREWPILAIFVAVAAIDLEHRIIPDKLNIAGAVLAAGTSFLDREVTVTGVFVGGAVGFGLFYGFAWLYYALTGRSGLGGGDIKFLGVVGLFLGLNGVFWTIFLSSIAGSVIGLGFGIWNARGKARENVRLMKVAIPYGPFLVFGALFYFFLRGNLEWLRFMTLT